MERLMLVSIYLKVVVIDSIKPYKMPLKTNPKDQQMKSTSLQIQNK